MENGEFILSHALLTRIDQYLKYDAEVLQSRMRLSQLRFSNPHNTQEIKETQDHIGQNNRAKLAVAVTLLKEEALWNKVHAETQKMLIFEHINAKIYREQITKNRFEANTLRKLEESMKKEITQGQEGLTEKVQKIHVRGFRH